MPQKDRSDLNVQKVLQMLWQGFDTFCRDFRDITGRACRRFEQRDWQGMHQDIVERLDLYQLVVDQTQSALLASLADQARDCSLWLSVREQFARQSAQRCDSQLAGTFYNSINRRIFQTVGIDPKLEFIENLEPAHDDDNRPRLVFSLMVERVSAQTISSILTRYRFRSEFSDLQTDAMLCARRIHRLLAEEGEGIAGVRIEMLKAAFFRDMNAYLIGRMSCNGRQWPLVFALGHDDQGLFVDALLLRPEEIRILFSFTRAYFHVQTPCPGELVQFLKQLMPQKRNAELYIVLGFHKHGKTELYRDLLDHRQVCGQDRFTPAAGQRGMVMIAFTMPEDDLIYKLIRDRFASPKKTTQQQVMEKYDYVFKHDRAGRLLDVQTFENLEIEQCCFTPELLAEIRREAGQTAIFTDDAVIFQHIYVERRVTPLDLYLQHAPDDAGEAAVIDYGQAIKDLAHINVFPGDMLIKNFGVTRLGRVVFYDYDELCPLTVCNFRHMPQAIRYEDALEAEPWFLVNDKDVFPEEFSAFLGLAPHQREVFLRHHADLLTPEFWQHTQAQIRAGVWTPILPYTDAQRLHRPRTAG